MNSSFFDTGSRLRMRQLRLSEFGVVVLAGMVLGLAAPAYAQSTETIGSLAAKGFEVKGFSGMASTPELLGTTAAGPNPSSFSMVLQKGAQIYICTTLLGKESCFLQK